jgi:hypothetical protein
MRDASIAAWAVSSDGTWEQILSNYWGKRTDEQQLAMRLLSKHVASLTDWRVFREITDCFNLVLD